MKLFAILGLLLIGANAHAYTSASGNDPNLGNYDVESKVVVKSEAAGFSDAITQGHALYYSEDELTGLYKVSRSFTGTANAATAVPYQACIAGRDVATGDVAGFPCYTRGYVSGVAYDATAAIAEGGYLCVGNASTNKGKLLACNTSVVSKFVALEAKASGSGTDLKVRVLSE